MNQLRDISSADMREYLRAEWCYTCKENDIQNAAHIQELVLTNLRRDSMEKWILDRNECTHIINNLCRHAEIFRGFTGESLVNILNSHSFNGWTLKT